MNERIKNDHMAGDESPIQAVLASQPDASDAANATVARDSTSRLQSRATVLLTLFIATGALGIPLLWVNKKFTQGERVFWSIMVLIYSTAVLALGGAIVIWMWNKTMSAIGP